MADLSKVKIGTVTYTLKDDRGRYDLATHIASLGSAAYLNVGASVTGSTNVLPTDKAVKDYVDAQVRTIHKFDVVVADELPTASEDTMYKLYLIPKAGSKTGNIKEEWITVRSGDKEPYTYSWEKIGDTEVDLSGYVTKATQIAGVTINSGISTASLTTALNLKELSHLDKSDIQANYSGASIAQGSVSYTPVGSVSFSLSQTATNATLTKGNFTPEGTITGSAISGGSISVSLKDQATATEATLTRDDYTPAGSVAGTVSVPSSAALSKNASGFQIEGTVSKPDVNVSAPTVSVLGSVVNAGTIASWTGATYTAPSVNEATASFAKAGVIATVGTGDDAECLIFSAADTGDAVTGTGFSAGNVNFGTFDGGAMPQFTSTAVVNGVTAALASAPTFTGEKYSVGLTNTNADISATFTGTKETGLKVTKAEYMKQSIDEATFSGTAASLGFAGTEKTNILVTGVSYDKAGANEATFTGSAGSIALPTVTVPSATLSITSK